MKSALRDADRLNAVGIVSATIATGSACHLDARLVHRALHDFPSAESDIFFIENVGNLVCPAIYDLGQAVNVVTLSVTEGEDKLLKYPVMFQKADLRWLPEHDSIRVATEQLNQSMRGAEPFELLIELAHGVDLREPSVLEALREIEKRAGRLQVGEIKIGQSLSLVDVVEETHRALGADPLAPLRLPTSREAVSQELLLFESAAPDDLARLADSQLRMTRVVMTVPFVDALYYPRFSRAVMAIADAVLEERGLRCQVSIQPTGLLMLAGETFDLLFVSMARSYTIAFGVIAVLMLLLIGQLRLGSLSAIPNLMPILLVLGLICWIDAPLDVSSMLVGGILIGVVVDDTIHFAHNYARYRSETKCSLRAIRDTLATTGRAMLVTSTVLSIGFFSFMGASLSNIADFGLLCGIGVILAFLADVVVLPALVALAAPCGADCPAHAKL